MTAPSFTLKTQAEIVAKLSSSRGGSDLFGFRTEVLAAYLTADQVRPFCKLDADLSDWTADPLDRDAVVATMADYMEFAWGKTEHHRDLGASRSVEKMAAWLWLLGDDEAVAYVEDGRHYKQYGAPVLLYICERYGLPIPESEELANMARGLPCRPGCDDGCAR